MQARALITFAAAVILAGGSVVLAHAWLTSTQDRQATSVAAGPDGGGETVQLAVAARALRYGDRLRPEDVKLVPWPPSAVPPGALHALAPLIGKPGKPAPIVMRPIEANEPVLTSKVTGFGMSARLAATIAPGMRATTIGMGGAPEMATMVGPGDRVDVLIARDVPAGAGLGAGAAGRDRELRSDVLLRDVRVLGLDQGAGGPLSSAGRKARAVTLEVTVVQAQKLAIAQKIGTLSLVLRGVRGAGSDIGNPISSRDLPAGRVLEAGWSASSVAGTDLTTLLADKAKAILPEPPQAAIRVFRGLESSEYTVSPEHTSATLRAIDAVKSGINPPAPEWMK